jgi:pimeloyl-ACP methyl ester carboxylesterase
MEASLYAAYGNNRSQDKEKRRGMSDIIPIVFIPGLVSSLRSHLPALADLWRHGSITVVNQTQDDSVAAMAARILSEAPPRFSLIGHSLGGYIALEIMRQAPDRVTRLALMNTQARPDPPEVTERRKSQLAASAAGNFEEVMNAFFALLVHPSRVGDASLREQLRLACLDAGPETFRRQQIAVMGRVDSRPFLPKIRVPTLVLSGDEDRLISNDFSREMAELIPNAALVIVPQCGHMAPLEQPQAVNAALDQWFAA